MRIASWLLHVLAVQLDYRSLGERSVPFARFGCILRGGEFSTCRLYDRQVENLPPQSLLSHANNSPRTSPSPAIGTGRPWVSRIIVCGSMPSRWNAVARMSF